MKKKPAIERKFTTENEDGKELILGIIKPTQKILQEANMKYSKSFGDGMRDGLLINREAEKIIKERNLWDEEVTEDFKNIQNEIFEKEKFLFGIHELTDEKAIAAAHELSILRERRWAAQRHIQSIYNNTAESRADEMRIQYIASQCMYNIDTNEPYYKSYNDFVDKSDTKAAGDSVYQVMIFLNGLSQNFMDELPEAKYLKAETEVVQEPKEEAKPSEEAPVVPTV